MFMPFGKYKDLPLEDVPEDYLLWVLDNVKLLSKTLRVAIEQRLGVEQPKKTRARRAKSPPPPPPPTVDFMAVCNAVLRAWQRKMTMRHHPDRGGSLEAMQLVNTAVDDLRKLFAEEFGTCN